MPSKLIDLTGKKFGQLTVIRHHNEIIKTKHGSTVHSWHCRCDCGKQTIVRGDCLTRGSTKSCGCSRHKVGRLNKCWRGFEDISASFWKQFKWSAKARKLPFKITMEYAWNLFLKQHKKCALTGLALSFPKDARDTSHNASLDRIDSTKGYVEGNVQWVDKRINFMKTTLENQEFIELCSLVSKNSNLIGYESHPAIKGEVAV